MLIEAAVALRNAVLFRAVSTRTCVYFLGRGAMMIDANEIRGRKVRRSVGVTRFRNTWLWRSAVHSLRPDLVLDVGANYGEVSFSSDYPAGCTVVLVEANGALVTLLNRSIATRSRREDWRVVHAAASDEHGEADFIISATSSGESRLDLNCDSQGQGQSERVRLVRLEDLPHCEHRQRIVFKIDIEGTEVQALRGFRKLLDDACSFLGIVELSPGNLRSAGTSPEALWELVRELGHVALFDHDDRLVDCSALTWSEIESASMRGALRVSHGADLVMYKSVPDLEALAPPRMLKSAEQMCKRVAGRLSKQTVRR